MPPSTLEQANGITDLLERAPLAGFLALTLLALLALFVLLMREKAAHHSTLREVVTLTSAISSQWEKQLGQQETVNTALRRIDEREQHRARRPGSRPEGM